MKVGRGGHVGMEEEAGRLGGRKGVRLGRHSGSGHGKKERRPRGGNCEDYAEELHQERNLRAGNVLKVCLSMSSPHGGVYGIDEPRHADLDRRLSGAMIVGEASVSVLVVVAAADV